MKLIRWLARAWPFVMLILIASIHYNIINFIPHKNIEMVNKAISAVTQIFGGIIVLISINSNLGLFQSNNLLTLLKNWLKSFPYFKNHQVITCSVNMNAPASSNSGEGHVEQLCNTLEEKVEESMRQIKEIRQLVYRKERELSGQISSVENSLKYKIYENQNQIIQLNGLLSKTAIGGIDLQIFGVLLVIYGAVFPIFSDL